MNLKNTEINFPLGIYEKAIDKRLTFVDKIKVAKKAGFDFIEMSVDESDEFAARLDFSKNQIKEIRDALFENDFYINSLCLSLHRKFPFGAKDEKIRQKALEIMEKALILAKNLGIRIIQLAAYDIYYEQPHPDSEIFFIQTMKKIVQLAKKYSVTIAFESMDTKFAGTISRLLYLQKQIGSGVLLYPDLGNLSRFSNDLEAEIKLGKSEIVAFHFKDTLPGIFKNLEFSQGDVDFVSAFSYILKAQIAVPFVIEMWHKEENFDQNLPLSENMAKQSQIIAKARDFFIENLRIAYENQR
ncbi:L-ribulose-5-phosphate 3-epimerase [Mesomycoplasma ovipneumoniae]|uniref:L-ribulose-5-phosphate 3-epimerase n=1 Tax=Mesomycoplasma ovipneumoniae TaxID=29562 RepID=UPI0026E3597D|nr:L-ribulose-5-phosphate 3-epimerase [Mesomycoplasma ovipneumoniae]MDO6856368.1 L-ribulose-5-phosphate 3-epimerase [Mesomycoplasma ovipneumoniae]MDW2906895.1 L-ribulose-5-phosphate 3-epimerase [Mesomycoplasma ovipneumoniae]MDW2909981.1 L-ribulose-5-phosphate 3-epimerase [Mesomycoplasma ovipneumoniae]MDW2915095.1 L-ribulose-5-phosphate 3-epimerase [Mesomycoplasma ovipneumoniae]MDW2919696.1 L-ribulose-5-phosphate 3-epimerase [Mesomycoplasma ovipneumoniae]